MEIKFYIPSKTYESVTLPDDLQNFWRYFHLQNLCKGSPTNTPVEVVNVVKCAKRSICEKTVTQCLSAPFSLNWTLSDCHLQVTFQIKCRFQQGNKKIKSVSVLRGKCCSLQYKLQLVKSLTLRYLVGHDHAMDHIFQAIHTTGLTTVTMKYE